MKMIIDSQNGIFPAVILKVALTAENIKSYVKQGLLVIKMR